jgi:hypothetical protein
VVAEGGQTCCLVQVEHGVVIMPEIACKNETQGPRTSVCASRGEIPPTSWSACQQGSALRRETENGKRET